MRSSLVKFADQRQHNGQQLFWGRVDQDGAPFRGQVPAVMREDEYEARVIRVRQFCNEKFDLDDAEANLRYCVVMDRIVNQWYELIYLDRFHKGTSIHYVEWVEYFMEDGSRTPFRPVHSLEVHPGDEPDGLDDPFGLANQTRRRPDGVD